MAVPVPLRRRSALTPIHVISAHPGSLRSYVQKPTTVPSSSATRPSWVRTASAQSRTPVSSPNHSGRPATIASQPSASSNSRSRIIHGSLVPRRGGSPVREWTLPLAAACALSVGLVLHVDTAEDRGRVHLQHGGIGGELPVARGLVLAAAEDRRAVDGDPPSLRDQ